MPVTALYKHVAPGMIRVGRMILLFLLFALFSHATGIVCPRGFTVVNNQKCLRMFSSHLKHLEAENDCAYFGGTLVTIKNAVDNRAVTNMAASAGVTNVWIGVYCFATGNTTTCYHDDGSGTISYKSFASGNPAVQSGGCVYMSVTGKSAGQWVSAPCEVIALPFVCESPPTVADPSCNLNYNGYCYMPSHAIPYSPSITNYTNAQSICQANGGYLASLHSKPEIDYVRGIYRNAEYSAFLLGAQAFLPDTFDWDDGSHWDYDYTDPLSKTKGSCLLMNLPSNDPVSGLWSETSRTSEYPFLCKRKILAQTSVSTMKPVEVKERNLEEALHINQKNLPHHQELLDFSNCNTTLYMAPGTITSYGYPNSKPPVTYCTWTVATLGPYRLGVYFTDFSTCLNVYLYDEHGNQLGNPSGNQPPFKVLGTSNIVKITHDSSYDATYGYHGFSATLLPF
ncbi:unnamed protein product [Caenorhabditis brenneri]